MKEIGISYQTADDREVHMIGGGADVDAPVGEARRGLEVFGAHHAVVYRGRTLGEGEVVTIVAPT